MSQRVLINNSKTVGYFVERAKFSGLLVRSELKKEVLRVHTIPLNTGVRPHPLGPNLPQGVWYSNGMAQTLYLPWKYLGYYAVQVQKQNQCLLEFVLIFNQMWLSQVLLMIESGVIVLMNSWELGAVSERKLPAVISMF